MNIEGRVLNQGGEIPNLRLRKSLKEDGDLAGIANHCSGWRLQNYRPSAGCSRVGLAAVLAMGARRSQAKIHPLGVARASRPRGAA